jgi:hypothetical protein
VNTNIIKQNPELAQADGKMAEETKCANTTATVRSGPVYEASIALVGTYRHYTGTEVEFYR